MKRLSTRLVSSHVAVALVGAATVAIVLRVLVPQLFDAATQGMGRGRGGSPLRDAVSTAIDSATWLALGGSLVLALALSWLAVTRLLGPLRRVREATRAIAEGDYVVAIPRPSEPELAALADDVTALGRAIGQTEQRRVRLLSEVAHELRTPLAVIDGYLEGMIDGVFPTDHEHLAALASETRRLHRLADDFSSLSRSEEGRWELHPRTIDLGEIVEFAAKRLGQQFDDAGVTLVVERADSVVLAADPERVAQVVTNLLGNALRATPAGGSVEVDVGNQDAHTARISVRDTGVGLSPVERTRVFERFYRGEQARQSEGSGIGLTIARALMRAHGGDLVAHSDGPGRGATFVATLPSSGHRFGEGRAAT